VRDTLSAWLNSYGQAAIAFGRASAISLAAVVLAIWAILTSGQYFTVIVTMVGIGATAWTAITARRVYAGLVLHRYKKSAGDHERRIFGFWLGAFVSFIGLLCWAWSGLDHIDL